MNSNPSDSYDYSIEYACRQRSAEVQKGIDKWVAHGGSFDHFKFVFAEEARLRDLMQRGPVGFRPCPEGFIVVSDRSMIKRGMLDYSKQISVTTDNFTKWFVEYKIANNINGVTFSWLSDFNMLWLLNAEKENRIHLWWDANPNADLLNRLTHIVYYLFLRGLGFPGMPIMDKLQTAFENGYFPVGWDGDSPMFLCLPEDVVNQKKSRSTKKRN